MAVLAVIAGSALTGCAEGPDFRTPEAPAATAYTATAMPPETAASPGPGGAAQRLVPGQEIPPQWWELLHSVALDQVIRQALANNPTLAAAQAALRQSRESLSAAYGSSLFPKVDANVSGSHQKITGAAFGQPETHFDPFTLYNASVSVSYALDLFGGARRELEALQSQVDFQRFQLGGLSRTYVECRHHSREEASLRAQIRATREIAAAQEKQLDLVSASFSSGG
jgi:outer membrane protein TolC